MSIIEQKKAEDEAKLEALRREVMLGVKSYERGDYITINSKEDMDKLFEEIHAEIGAEIAAEK